MFFRQKRDIIKELQQVRTKVLISYLQNFSKEDAENFFAIKITKEFDEMSIQSPKLSKEELRALSVEANNLLYLVDKGDIKIMTLALKLASQINEAVMQLEVR